MEKKTQYRLILLGFVLILVVAAVFAYRQNHERADALPNTTNLAVYTNPSYGYSFYYPTDFTVRVASDEQVNVGVATSSAYVTYVETRIATSSDAASYDEFLTTAAKSLCTEQPGYSCSKVAQTSTYHTETNLTGSKMYLDMTAPDGSVQRFGPVYSFNVGGNVVHAKYATIFIFRPLGAQGEVEILPAEDVASKLQITKVK